MMEELQGIFPEQQGFDGIGRGIRRKGGAAVKICLCGEDGTVRQQKLQEITVYQLPDAFQDPLVFLIDLTGASRKAREGNAAPVAAGIPVEAGDLIGEIIAVVIVVILRFRDGLRQPFLKLLHLAFYLVCGGGSRGRLGRHGLQLRADTAAFRDIAFVFPELGIHRLPAQLAESVGALLEIGPQRSNLFRQLIGLLAVIPDVLREPVQLLTEAGLCTVEGARVLQGQGNAGGLVETADAFAAGGNGADGLFYRGQLPGVQLVFLLQGDELGRFFTALEDAAELRAEILGIRFPSGIVNHAVDGTVEHVFQHILLEVNVLGQRGLLTELQILRLYPGGEEVLRLQIGGHEVAELRAEVRIIPVFETEDPIILPEGPVKLGKQRLYAAVQRRLHIEALGGAAGTFCNGQHQGRHQHKGERQKDGDGAPGLRILHQLSAHTDLEDCSICSMMRSSRDLI